MIVIALATQVPLAVALEVALHSSNVSLLPSICTVGVPEELAKAIPVLVVALIYHRRNGLVPRDYLFLGAVSGLAFGASEVVHYFTVNGVVEFCQAVQSSVPSIEQLIATGHSASTSLFAVLIGPVRYFILNFVWRFLTDPITHACWSGLTGYFIGLAATGRYRWYAVAWIGLAMAAILHGLNDWGQVNGHPVWILVVALSGILFLGYAKVGARGDLRARTAGRRRSGYTERRRAMPSAHTGPVTRTGRTPGSPRRQAGTTGPCRAPAGPPGPRRGPRPRCPARPWWEH